MLRLFALRLSLEKSLSVILRITSGKFAGVTNLDRFIQLCIAARQFIQLLQSKDLRRRFSMLILLSSKVDPTCQKIDRHFLNCSSRPSAMAVVINLMRVGLKLGTTDEFLKNAMSISLTASSFCPDWAIMVQLSLTKVPQFSFSFLGSSILWIRLLISQILLWFIPFGLSSALLPIGEKILRMPDFMTVSFIPKAFTDFQKYEVITTKKLMISSWVHVWRQVYSERLARNPTMSQLVILTSYATSGQLECLRILSVREWMRQLRLWTAVESIRSRSQCLKAEVMMKSLDRGRYTLEEG